MEDIDDLSDTEKVSLISDLELNEEPDELSYSSNQLNANIQNAQKEQIIESKDNNLNMNLLKV